MKNLSNLLIFSILIIKKYFAFQILCVAFASIVGRKKTNNGTKGGLFDGLKIKSDEGRGLSFNNDDIKSFNTNVDSYSNAYARNQVESFMSVMEKVKDGGNCIFAICNLGTSELDIANSYAEQLSTLSGNRLNLFTINGLSAAWINNTRGSSNIGATVVSGTLNSSLNAVQPYWNRIGPSGAIINTYKEIILRDSSNPVEFK